MSYLLWLWPFAGLALGYLSAACFTDKDQPSLGHEMRGGANTTEGEG